MAEKLSLARQAEAPSARRRPKRVAFCGEGALVRSLAATPAGSNFGVASLAAANARAASRELSTVGANVGRTVDRLAAGLAGGLVGPLASVSILHTHTCFPLAVDCPGLNPTTLLVHLCLVKFSVENLVGIVAPEFRSNGGKQGFVGCQACERVLGAIMLHPDCDQLGPFGFHGRYVGPGGGSAELRWARYDGEEAVRSQDQVGRSHGPALLGERRPV